MIAFPRSRSTLRVSCLLGALALFSVSACATSGGAGNQGSSDPGTIDTGYGTLDKDQSAGSATTVQAENEGVRQPRTLVEMLSRVPGVQVSTLAGNQLRIRIRGGSSFQGGEDPLFVLDGMVVQSLESINPTTIESIRVLKDAEATAVYGSRGANGVILVKTKRD